MSVVSIKLEPLFLYLAIREEKQSSVALQLYENSTFYKKEKLTVAMLISIPPDATNLETESQYMILTKERKSSASAIVILYKEDKNSLNILVPGLSPLSLNFGTLHSPVDKKLLRYPMERRSITMFISNIGIAEAENRTNLVIGIASSWTSVYDP
ncbi:hypothetical protein RHMOL_Rhmol11G0160100 [Rhododendron molle]|uniref:Uncharacterized protein n=1 Tax=Rhododendron molle TaxID=49168 RepID=A0ACC0LSJ4_RHOML|nr:hypothetical protein RHMOL_Rhmol11G0160100 [Rhododendron molle]